MRTVRYSFHEHFPADLNPDSTQYGTLKQFAKLYPDSYWEKRLANLTNDDGSLAWLVSQDILACIYLFDFTGDPSYLRWPREYAIAAMAARDDHAGLKDEEGRLSPGWGTSRYGDNTRRVYLVHSGLIINPILEWAVRAPATSTWNEEDEKLKARLVDQSLETMLWHDYQLAEDAPPGELVYETGREEPDRRHAWQPFNRQNLFARNFYLLYRLRGDETFRDRSQKLYSFFRNRLELTRSNAYVWDYEPVPHTDGIPRVVSCDDVSHGSFSLLAVLPACRDGFVFDHEDLERFARTFAYYIHLGDGVLQSKIGCWPSLTPRYMKRIYAWLPLAEADPSVYTILRDFLMHNVEKPEPLAVALLVSSQPKWTTGIDTRVRGEKR